MKFLIVYDTGEELAVELPSDRINEQIAIHAFVSFMAIGSARHLKTVDGILAIAWGRVLHVLPLDKEEKPIA